MTQPDDELKQVFQQLGIELLDSHVPSLDERQTRKLHELTDEELLRWIRQLGADSPAPLVDEVRKRQLMPESEIKLWLSA